MPLEKEERHTETENGRVTLVAETGVMQPQAQRPPEAGQGREDPPPSLWRERSPASPGFWMSGLQSRVRKNPCAKPPGLLPPQEMNTNSSEGFGSPILGAQQCRADSQGACPAVEPP